MVENQLYKDAVNYANNLNATPNLELSLNGNTINVKVSGNFNKFKLTINGITTAESKEINSIWTKTFDVSGYTSSEMNVKVEALKTKYTAEYYVLKHATGNGGSIDDSLQRLIVVTGLGTNEEVAGTANKDITINTNVSLQKYITHVNDNPLTSNETNLTQRKNTYRWENNGSVTVNEQMNNQYKHDDVVVIEAGDYVTYKIHVYNNSNVTAQSITVKDNLPYGVDKYSIDNGAYIYGNSFDHIIYNLAGNSSTDFTVKVHFNNYSDEILTNTAKISGTTPPNNTTYRTEDSDYVRMKEYKVSLEKYISYYGKNIEDVPNLNNYKSIISYLIKSNINDKKLLEEKLDQLINIYKNNKFSRLFYESFENNILYDIDNNGKVDQADIDLYNKLKVIKFLELNTYINSDLNNDGIVDDKDKDIYIFNKANLYNDDILNDLDKYRFILKTLKNDGFLTEKELNYINIEKLLKDRKKEKDNLRDEIQNYINGMNLSDVNQDGIVSLSDKYFFNDQQLIEEIKQFELPDEYEIRDNKLFVENDEFSLEGNYRIENNGKLLIVEKAYNKLNAISEEINNLLEVEDFENKLNDFMEEINIYDVNQDGLLNSNDIAIISEYNQSDEIALQDFIHNFNFELNKDTEYNEDFDYNMDSKINFEDYIEFKNEGISLDFLNGLKNYLVFSNEKYNKEYDFNFDTKIDFNDYEILNQFIKIREILKGIGNNGVDLVDELNSFINNYNLVDEDLSMPGFGKEDIIAIRLLKGYQYNEEYLTINSDLDLNGDGKVNQEDIEFLNVELANSELKTILDNNINDDFINLFKEAKESNILDELEIDYTEFKFSDEKNDYEILTNIIEEINNKYTNEELATLIKNTDIQKYTEAGYNDINNALTMNISELDINEDGKINVGDINYLKDLGIRSQGDINTMTAITQDFINNNDINNDGVIDEDDYKLYKDLKTWNDSIDIKNEIIDQVLNADKSNNTDDRAGKAEYLTKETYKDDTDKDTQLTRHNTYKYDKVVEVNKNDYVIYTIKVRNDGNTNVYITEITDYLPDGIEYDGIQYTGGQYNTKTDNVVKFNNLAGTLLTPGQSASFTVKVKVIEPNKSIQILKNTAAITQIKNKNNIEVRDKTPYNNEDSDYLQMKDIVISGKIWNDKALDKTQDNYNGIKDDVESLLSGSEVKVKLNRVGQGIIGENNTHSGTYTFYGDDNNCIKGPKVNGTNRWKGYYIYTVEFEYDGITYTPTEFAEVTSNNSLDSNAKEDLNNRKEFNSKFSTINANSEITYITKNDSEYIPQSNHEYDNNKMKITASTNFIDIARVNEEQLKHVNLGLRGRNVFDLELTSDVFSTKVTVNGNTNGYNYNSNKVTVRREDINDFYEDANNISNEKREANVGKYDQLLRKTDVATGDRLKYLTGSNYDSTGLAIEVTYRITVKNTTTTGGTATKVTNYYDNRYTLKEVKGDTVKNSENGTSGTGYKSVIINIDQNAILAQNDDMNIYITYTLNNPTTTLDDLANGNGVQKIPTFNMAEITEYRTVSNGNDSDEYVRGLLDKDSAPGSVNSEVARLTEGTTELSTLSYYFGGNDLSKLKYEDDTYATPTLYFTTPNDPDDPKDNNDSEAPDYRRTIEGYVFEDKTTTNPSTKIKTGNGKLDNGEIGVYGASVELIEKTKNGDVVRYTTTTDETGKFVFRCFLPGDYYIKYSYGDTTKTVLLNQSNGVNNKSYNGEDYQSTNNTGSYDSETLSNRPEFWYLDNESEGVSTANDDVTRRNTVSKNVIEFIDEEMQVLNNMRDGKSANDSKVSYRNNENKTVTVTADDIINATKMYAATKPITLTMEKSFLDGDDVKQPTTFSEYKITNMNFGIAEVPVATIDLQKKVKEFTITDSTGNNILAGLKKNSEGNWEVIGGVLPLPEGSKRIDVSIEDDKLQGARLEVTYEVTSKITTEKNFDAKELTVPTITGVVDYISNNMSYNEALGENSKYWELTTYNEIKQEFAKMKYKEGTTPQGTIDPEGKGHVTIVKARKDNPILTNKDGNKSATITLEKVLTSTDSTIEQIINSSVDSFEYNNTIEITGLDYGNVTPETPDQGDDGGDKQNPDPQRDRIRTTDRYIIVPGVHHDTAGAETIVIHPPTGYNGISMIYYIMAVISLGILSAGIFFIKKYVVKK